MKKYTKETFTKAVTLEEAIEHLEIPVSFLERSAQELYEIISMSQEDVDAKAEEIRSLAKHQDEQKRSWFASIQRQIDEHPNPDSDEANTHKDELAALKKSHESNLTMTGDKWRRNRLIHIQNNITAATNHIKAARQLKSHPIQIAF